MDAASVLIATFHVFETDSQMIGELGPALMGAVLSLRCDLGVVRETDSQMIGELRPTLMGTVLAVRCDLGVVRGTDCRR